MNSAPSLQILFTPQKPAVEPAQPLPLGGLTGGQGLHLGIDLPWKECAVTLRWRETLPALSPGHAGKQCAQESAHLCHLFRVTLGKSLPVSELVSISMKERKGTSFLIRKGRRFSGKMYGAQLRVGA